MSRIGRAPITVPSGVNVEIKKTEVVVKGSKGQLTVPVSPRLTVKQEDGEIHVERPTDNRMDRAQHGLARSLINNAVVGVTGRFQPQSSDSGRRLPLCDEGAEFGACARLLPPCRHHAA